MLLEEVLELLSPQPGEVCVDCTAGLGGHAAAIAERMGAGTVVLNDADPGNLAAARERVSAAAPGVRVFGQQGNFADTPRKVAGAGLSADMVLADLGFSSSQMEDTARGLSFMRNGPLDMRFDPSSPVTAAELVASLPEGELARILAEYGEEREARRIAQKLVAARKIAPIQTTGQLADIVRSAVGRRSARDAIDPATRTFQALRIAVNDELGSLGALLAGLERGAAEAMAGKPGWLSPGARVAIISFHSLEDRPVKRALAEMVQKGHAALINRKPIEAADRELVSNPRARSAKLRGVRVGDGGGSGGAG